MLQRWKRRCDRQSPTGSLQVAIALQPEEGRTAWAHAQLPDDRLGRAPEIRQRFLHDNAVKAFKLPV